MWGRMKKFKMGKVQMRIMDVLCEKKRASALDITAEINKSESIKHSTVQTFLRVLVNKNIIRYEVEERTFIYYPVVDESQIKQIKQTAVNDLVQDAFRGSIRNLVCYILENENMDIDEFEKIREEIKNKKKKQ